MILLSFPPLSPGVPLKPYKRACRQDCQVKFTEQKNANCHLLPPRHISNNRKDSR